MPYYLSMAVEQFQKCVEFYLLLIPKPAMMTVFNFYAVEL